MAMRRMSALQRKYFGKRKKSKKRSTTLLIRRRGSTMARRKGVAKRRSGGFKLPIAIVAGFMPGLTNLNSAYQAGGWNLMSDTASRQYIGFSPSTGRWNFDQFRHGTFPIILGVAVHKLAGFIGVNRALGRMGIPIIRL